MDPINIADNMRENKSPKVYMRRKKIDKRRIQRKIRKLSSKQQYDVRLFENNEALSPNEWYVPDCEFNGVIYSKCEYRVFGHRAYEGHFTDGSLSITW